MSSEPDPHPAALPPPLAVAASVVGLQGLVLVLLTVVELLAVDPERMSLGVSTAVFFAIYGALLLGSAWALRRRQGWARGPVLLTQLIQLGLAWNLRDFVLPALLLAATALVVLAGVLHPRSLAALSDDPTG